MKCFDLNCVAELLSAAVNIHAVEESFSKAFHHAIFFLHQSERTNRFEMTQVCKHGSPTSEPISLARKQQQRKMDRLSDELNALGWYKSNSTLAILCCTHRNQSQ